MTSFLYLRFLGSVFCDSLVSYLLWKKDGSCETYLERGFSPIKTTRKIIQFYPCICKIAYKKKALQQNLLALDGLRKELKQNGLNREKQRKEPKRI